MEARFVSDAFEASESEMVAERPVLVRREDAAVDVSPTRRAA